jgi:cadmium resistance protein CadD (predicted permease)
MSAPYNAPGVSSVTFPKPAWRYLLLFQSWSQLQSWGVCVLAMLVLIHLFFGLSDTHELPMQTVAMGAVLGSLASVVMVLPSTFVVSACPERVVHALTSELEVLGYVLQGSQAGTLVYRQKLPRLLRWDEGNVTIARAGDRIIVTGPLMILKKAQHFLVRRVIA